MFYKKNDFILKFIIYWGTFFSGAVIFAIFIIMLFLSAPFFYQGGIKIFITHWDPVNNSYGIMPMIAGTIATAVPALILAIPFSLGFAVFACKSTGFTKKAALILIRTASAIPTVVYSFAGIFIIIPFMRSLKNTGSGYCMLSAILVLAVLISPTMIFFFYDSISSVNDSIRKGALALGADIWETNIYIIIPAAKKGIFSGIILGLGRALGDTMISLMLAGNSAVIPHSIFEGTRTLTAHIALVMAADYDSPEFRSVFACGITLYILTALLSISARTISRK